jgi:hypothetical protein
MIEEKTNKFNLIIYLLVFITLFTMLIGSSYLYFTNKIKNEAKTKVTIKNADILVKYKDGDKINATGIKPGWSSSFSFSLENYSSDITGKYKIIIDIISPLTNEIEDNFVYTLSGASTSTDTPVNVSETVMPIETTTVGECSISPSTLHTYTFTLKLKNNNQNTNYFKGKIFVAKITVEKVNI